MTFNNMMVYLAPIDDIMAPVVWSTSVTPFTDGVWRTDALSCVSFTVVAHVTALTGYREGENATEHFSLHLLWRLWMFNTHQNKGEIKYTNCFLSKSTTDFSLKFEQNYLLKAKA